MSNNHKQEEVFRKARASCNFKKGDMCAHVEGNGKCVTVSGDCPRWKQLKVNAQLQELGAGGPQQSAESPADAAAEARVKRMSGMRTGIGDQHPIQDMWTSYAEHVLPAEASDGQKIETKRAFYAGAHSMFQTVAHSTAVLEEHQVVALFDAIEKEAVRFCQAIERGDA